MRRMTSLLGLAWLLSACGGGSGGGSDRAGDWSEPPAPPARASHPAGLGCGWQAMFNIDTFNAAYPDEAAAYWVALVPKLPGARLRIDGRYPAARYFSYNTYDPAIRPIDAIADVEIAPIVPGSNPYVSRGVRPGAPYTAYVEFAAEPAEPAANTVYAGDMDLGGRQVPTVALVPLIYRVYVAQGVADGGVGLPVLTLETADGAQELLPYADCDSPLLPDLGGSLPPLGLNEALTGIDYPEQLALARFPTASYPPRTGVFYGMPNALLQIINHAVPVALPPALQSTEIGSGGGFLSNEHNAYTITAFSRADGNLFLLRGKAPTFATQPGVAPGSEDVRYWSVCQNEFATQRFVACSVDYQTPLDDEGYYTVVVSDAADRLRNASGADGYSWIPGGPYDDGVLLVRQMLPAAAFEEAIANVPQGKDPQAHMGAYFPVGSYCTRETFETTPGDAASVFAACHAEMLRRGPGLGPLPPR